MTAAPLPERGLGPLLRELRARTGLTQAELAERAELSARGLQKIESGGSMPYRATALRLAEALGLQGEEAAQFMATARQQQAAAPLGMAALGEVRSGAALPPPPRGDRGRTGVDGVRARIDEHTQAGFDALRAGLLAEALSGFERARALLDALPESPGVQRRRLSILGAEWAPQTQLGRIAAYEELLARAEPTALALGDPGVQGMLANRLAYCRWAAGDLDRARTLWMKALDLSVAGGNAEEIVVAQVMLQWCRLTQAEYPAVLLSHEQTLMALDRAPNPTWRMWAQIAATCAYALRGRRELALVEAEEALAIAEEAGASGSRACAVAALALVNALAPGPVGSETQVAPYGTLPVGATPLERAWTNAAHGWLLSRAGATPRGRALLLEALQLVRSLHVMPAEVSVLLALAEAAGRTGAVASLPTDLQTVLAQVEPAAMPWHAAVAHRLLAEAAMLDPHLGSSADHAQRALALFRDIGAELEVTRAQAILTRTTPG